MFHQHNEMIESEPFMPTDAEWNELKAWADQARKALAKIAREYGNQDMSHEDYRVHAAIVATDALQKPE